ncbi:18197_t:CDS:2, partial [Cetraspora pellucida]
TRHKENINDINNLIRNNKHIKALYKEYQTERSATKELVHQNTIEFILVKTMDQDETLDETLDE